MDAIEVSTVVYVPPTEVYEFLTDFPRYARYSKYLDRVTQDGDGEPGTRYDMTFSWWKLSYTAESEVTAVDPPTGIDWRLVKDLHARGRWRVDRTDPPEGQEEASRVRLLVEFEPGSADGDAVDLPRLVSLDWVVEKVTPLVQEEAERVVERIVADIEGQRRDVELSVHTTPDSV